MKDLRISRLKHDNKISTSEVGHLQLGIEKPGQGIARNKELDQIRESHESHIEIMLEKDHSNEVSQKEIEELKSKLADQEKKAK